MPTEDQIVAQADQINHYIAEQILQVVVRWGGQDEVRRVQLLNYLCNQVESKGREHWEELRWSVLVSRINHLSSQINHTVDEISGQSPHASV